MTADVSRERAIQEYRKKINEHRQIDVKLKDGISSFFLIVKNF